MITYKKGSNQYQKKQKFSLLDGIVLTGIVLYAGALLTKGAIVKATDYATTDYLRTVDFATPSALTVFAEPKLIVEPTPVKPPKGIKQEIFEYLVEKFGDHAGDAIAIIRTCENGTFEPSRVSGVNKNGTIDVGVMQINVDANNTKEIEKLKDFRYNIDRGYMKWKQGDGGAHRNSFYLWTCGKVINQYTYVDRMNGK